MSENSEEKTNRKLSKFIEDDYFQFEYSIFPYVDSLMYEVGKEEAIKLVLEYSSKVKRLIKKNKDYAFLIRWRRNQKIYSYSDVGERSLDQIYMMIHSPIRLNELVSYCNATDEIKCIYRPSTSYTKQRATQKIRKKNKNRLNKRLVCRTEVNEILSKKIKLYTFLNKDQFKF